MASKQVSDNIEFKCGSESLEQIPEEIVARTGIDFPEAHQDKISMAVLAKELKKYRGDVITRIPFCVISSLLDPMDFFKGIRQDREQMDKFIQVIEDSIVKYILAGLEKGARIISYADPVGSLDIVGPRVYRELSGKISCNILKRIEGHLDNVLVHLCGKTFTGLKQLELCTTQALETEEGITYGQALLEVLNSGRGIKFIGHRCIKTTPCKLAKPVVWGINL